MDDMVGAWMRGCVGVGARERFGEKGGACAWEAREDNTDAACACLLLPAATCCTLLMQTQCSWVGRGGGEGDPHTSPMPACARPGLLQHSCKGGSERLTGTLFLRIAGAL